MVTSTRQIRQTRRAGASPAAAPAMPAPLIEALRDLIRREQAEQRHRPARVYLPGRTIVGTALIQPSGWLEVYDDDLAGELATKLQRVRVQLVKAQQAGDRDQAADLERDAHALQTEITQRETVLSESFPPQRIVSIEWLLDDEPATGCDLFGYAAGEVN